MVTRRKAKNYYSSHYLATQLSFGALASVHNGNHNGVDRIFMGLYSASDSWIRHSSNGGQQEDKRAQNSTTMTVRGLQRLH